MDTTIYSIAYCMFYNNYKMSGEYKISSNGWRLISHYTVDVSPDWDIEKFRH